MLWLFRKLVDPVGQRQEDEERRRQREELPPDADGAVGGEVVLPELERATRAHQCRVCGRTAQLANEDARFCASCLAETMEPAR